MDTSRRRRGAKGPYSLHPVPVVPPTRRKDGGEGRTCRGNPRTEHPSHEPWRVVRQGSVRTTGGGPARDTPRPFHTSPSVTAPFSPRTHPHPAPTLDCVRRPRRRSEPRPLRVRSSGRRPEGLRRPRPSDPSRSDEETSTAVELLRKKKKKKKCWVKCQRSFPPTTEPPSELSFVYERDGRGAGGEGRGPGTAGEQGRRKSDHGVPPRPSRTVLSPHPVSPVDR